MPYNNSLFKTNGSENEENQAEKYNNKISSLGQVKATEQEQKNTSDRVNKKLGDFIYNPFLKSDGSLSNPYLPYQKLLDSAKTPQITKDWISTATGLSQTNSDGTDASFEANVSGLNASTLSKMDIASELPKLSEAQISKIISTHFKNSSVISSSDAAGIKAAQDKTGMSALAILGIGALESGYGTSRIANNTGNLWGYGATNINPEGNAHKYGQVSNGALTYATEFMKDYYSGYGAKSIYATGTGNNPAGKGYAYYDNGSINASWADSVSNIMANFCNTLSNAGLSGRPKGSGASKGKALVESAKKYLGTKYVWGGTTPDGFDCSGLMQYACRENGIDISRTTYDQIKDGKAVSKGELQEGDLILFGTASDPHHVGMYVGNGQYIHAPRTGDVVKISNLSDRNDYLCARRVV